MRFAIPLLTAALFFYCTGCSHKVAEELSPAGSCDTTHVTYSVTIRGLLNTYGCLGCHNSASQSGGLNYETYAGLKAKVDDGRLWGAINHLPGYSPMPEGRAKMSDCDINKVAAWIHAGAPNN